MFPTDFKDCAELAEPHGLFVDEMDEAMATQLKWRCQQEVLLSSENSKIYNRLLWVSSDGSVSCYDKRHLISNGGKRIKFFLQEKTSHFWIKRLEICTQSAMIYASRLGKKIRTNQGGLAYDLIFTSLHGLRQRVAAWDAFCFPASGIENLALFHWSKRIGVDGKPS